MKTVCKKLLCLMLVAMMLVSVVPTAFAAGCNIIMELHIDGAYQTEEPCTIEEGTILDEGTVKLYAEQYVYPAYFTNAEYEYDGVGTANAAAAAGTRVIVRFKSVKTGCQHTDTITGTTATCTAGGNTIVRCSNPECREILSNTAVEALGHNFKNGVCTRCGEVESTNNDGNQGELEQQKELVDITIYEVDGDNNAVEVDFVKNVDVNSYASTDAMVKAIYGGNYTKYQYRNGVLRVWPLASKDDKAVYQLQIIHNNGTSDRTYIDILEGEGILAAIKNAGVQAKLKKVVDGEEYRLVGFSLNHTGNAKYSVNIYHVASADLADANGNIKVYCDWEPVTDDDSDDEFEYGYDGGLFDDDTSDPLYDAILYVYTNGKTSSYAKKITNLGAYTKDGKLTRGEVELIVQNYFKTTSKTTYNGLFTTETWNKGHYLNMNAKYEIDLDPDKTISVYVMVTDATAYVADSTNPKTGDYITIAVTGMALSAAALVSMIELKKRKMI